MYFNVCDLGGCVDVSSLSEQQARHLGVALLRCEVQRADPLLGQDVRLCAVLQQRQRDLRLVLLGCNVEWGVAILGGSKGTELLTVASVQQARPPPSH